MSNVNFNIPANDIVDAIKTCYHAKRTPLFIGPPGVGKTAMVRLAASHLQLELVKPVHVEEFHLTSVSEVDVRGYLIPDGDNARFTKPAFWDAVENHPYGILFLDEFVQAPHEVQKAVAPLIYERRIGSYQLPDGWMVVLAGNGLDDGAGANTLLSHVVNRLSIVKVNSPTPDDWAMWAIEAGLEPEVIAFAKFRPEVVFAGTVPKAPDAPYCTPRSIHACSDLAKHYPGGIRAMVDNKLGMALLAGVIGGGPAGELAGLVRTAMNLPSYEQVVANPTGTPIPEGLDMRYAMVMLVAVRCQLPHMEQVCTYLARFDPNFAVTGFVALCRRNPQFMGTPAAYQWIMANQPLLQKFSKYITV
jgi:hypothetical protein